MLNKTNTVAKTRIMLAKVFIKYYLYLVKYLTNVEQMLNKLNKYCGQGQDHAGQGFCNSS